MQQTQEMGVWSLGQEDPLEEGMAAHSSIPACRIPWTEEPSRLQSMGSQRVGHDWSDLACTHVAEKELSEDAGVGGIASGKAVKSTVRWTEEIFMATLTLPFPPTWPSCRCRALRSVQISPGWLNSNSLGCFPLEVCREGLPHKVSTTQLPGTPDT